MPPTTDDRSDGRRSALVPPTRGGKAGRGIYVGSRGFTLLEVLVAVAILAISLTSLLSSQMDALRATRYAQTITAVAFLAEAKLIDIEFELKRDGWGDADKDFEGDFAEEGWPEVTYTCLVDMIEMPEYQALQIAADSADTDGPGAGGPGGMNVQDAGEQAFDMLGVVWPMIKSAIEQSIRKVTCTAFWRDGEVEHDFQLATFWTDPSKLAQLPQAGGEAGEGDDTEPDPNDPQGGGTPSGTPGTKPTAPTGPTGPTAKPGMR